MFAVRKPIPEGSRVRISVVDANGRIISTREFIPKNKNDLVQETFEALFPYSPIAKNRINIKLGSVDLSIVEPSGVTFFSKLPPRNYIWWEAFAEGTSGNGFLGLSRGPILNAAFRTGIPRFSPVGFLLAGGACFIANNALNIGGLEDFCNTVQQYTLAIPLRLFEEFYRSRGIKLLNDPIDSTVLASLVNKDCNPGSILALPSRTGSVVCTNKRKWEGECLPGEIRLSNFNGLPEVCSESYKYESFYAGRWFSDESLRQFRLADEKRKSLEEKYGIKIRLSLGYWGVAELERLDKLLSSLPESLYKGRTIDLFVGWHLSYGGDVVGLESQTLHIYDTRRPDYEYKAWITAAVVHELMHTRDISTTGLIFQLSSSGEYRQILRNYNIRYEGTEIVENQVKYTLYANSGKLDGDYNCSLNRISEFFACAGTLYVFKPEKVKKDFPDLYNYYKNRVFNGQEYLGRDLAKEILGQ